MTALDTRSPRSGALAARKAAVAQSWIVHGVNRAGKRVRQPVKAYDKAEALRIATTMLKIQASRVTEAASEKNPLSLTTMFDELRFYKGLEASRELFWDTVSSVLRSEGTLAEAIEQAAENAIEPRFRAILQSVLVELANGEEAHIALGKYPECFSPAELKLVELGRRDVRMAAVVDRIATDNQRASRFRLKIFSVTASSRFTVLIALIMVIVAGKVVPNVYAPVYSTFNPPLPFGPFTRAAMTVSNTILSPMMLVAIILFGVPGFYAAQKFLRRPDVRRRIESIRQGKNRASQLLFPTGKLDQRLAVERMCALFAMLMATGKINFQDAAKVVARSIESVHLRDALEAITEDIASTRSDTMAAVEAHLTEFDPILVARFRTAIKVRGDFARVFGDRANAITFEVENRDFARLQPRILMASQVPVTIATAWAGLAFFEPLINMTAHLRFHQ